MGYPQRLCDTDAMDTPSDHELQALGRERAAKKADYEDADQRLRDMVVKRLKADPDQRREDLAALSGLSVDVVKRLAQAAGVPSPRTKAKTKQHTDDKIARLLKERPTDSTAQLAAAAGVSPQRITAYLREHGLPPRPRRRAS